MPKSYRCFCRKCLEPVYDRNETPHSCGEVCGKELEANKHTNDDGKSISELRCPHKCLELCHPGPCPPCRASVVSNCPCGKSRQTGRCGKISICTAICEKRLNCGIHQCTKTCHAGDCGQCEEEISQTCFCDRGLVRSVLCSEETVTQKEGFSCEMKCDRPLNCGNHKCVNTCHSGSCEECVLSPDVVKVCYCGKSKIMDLREGGRKSCLEPVPTCKNRCEKDLKCGPGSKHHICTEFCHEDACPPCSLTSKVNYSFFLVTSKF